MVNDRSTATPIEVKTIGQLFDELSIVNIRIWMLIDKVMGENPSVKDAVNVQKYNKTRNELVAAINRRFNEREADEKVYR